MFAYDPFLATPRTARDRRRSVSDESQAAVSPLSRSHNNHAWIAFCPCSFPLALVWTRRASTCPLFYKEVPLPLLLSFSPRIHPHLGVATMTELSQPWADYTFLGTALDSDMAQGMQAGAARAVDFVGPMMLGAIVWDIVVTDLSLLLSLPLDYLTHRRASTRQEMTTVTLSVTALSTVSRLSALACISIYIVFAQGGIAADCRVWPLSIVALGALSYSLALGAALFRTVFLSPPSRWSKVLLSALWLATAATTFAAIATWQGGYQKSSNTCSLQVYSSFGIF